MLVVTACLAATSLLLVLPLASWLGHAYSTVQIWASGLVFSVAAIGIAGVYRPIDPLDSIDALAFFSVIQGLLVAVLGVLGAVFMINLEDDLRGSTRVAAFLAKRSRDKNRDKKN